MVNDSAAGVPTASPSLDSPGYPFPSLTSYEAFAGGPGHPMYGGHGLPGYPPHPHHLPPWFFHEHYLQSHLSGGDDGAFAAPPPFPPPQASWPGSAAMPGRGPEGGLGMMMGGSMPHGAYDWSWAAQADPDATGEAEQG